MAQSGKPVRVGVHQVELVASTQVVVLVCRGKAIVTVQYRGLDDHICTCLVQCNRVCRSQNAEVGHDGGIVVVPAVAFGRYVHDEADVEMGLAHNDSEGIFRNLVVQALGGIFGSHHGTVVLAEGYALSATYAFGVVYFCLAAGIEVHSVVCAVLHADVAAYAAFYVNLGLRGAMQFQLSAYAGTSHAQILQGAAKTGLFVPLEVVHTDYNIGIGYRCADFGCRTIFPVQRDFAVVRSLQSVADDDLALGRNGG